jgi:hypothetical protein
MVAFPDFDADNLKAAPGPAAAPCAPPPRDGRSATERNGRRKVKPDSFNPLFPAARLRYMNPLAAKSPVRRMSMPCAPLIDPFARAISYLRVSVTDRCDFRCVYCMSENMTFLPKKELLTLEELDRMCSTFVRMGVEEAAHHRGRAAGAAGHHDLLPVDDPASRRGR